MTSREKQWLTIGILGGAIVAIAAAGAFIHFNRAPMPETTGPPPAANAPAPAAAAPQDNRDAAVQLSPDEQTKIGLETAEVRRESVAEDIVAIGRVVEPETAIGTVSTRFGGRVERLFVSFPGQPVKKGDPIAIIAITGQPVGKDDPVSSIYNRDLIAATEEYKFALENRQHANAISRPEAVAQAEALVQASRVRLERFGITPEQIDGPLPKPEQPIRVTVDAGTSGIVRSRKVTEGQFVNAGDALVELTDLSTVWVMADVFDDAIARIRPGLTATIRSDALPGVKLTGSVDFIEPRSDPQARTTPVRIQVANPGTRLKPGMIVQPSFHLELGAFLTVPREAVLDTGQEKLVYVAQDNGIFQKRRIQVGSPTKDRYPVLEGLTAGERVVTNGVFLVDSQTRLTGGLAGLFGGSKTYADSAFKATFRIDPDPPQGAQQNTVRVSLMDSAGKPVSDAQVRITLVMPAMPAMNMAEMRNSADLKWTGSEYSGPIQVQTAGGWNVSVEARRGNDLLATVQTRINAR